MTEQPEITYIRKLLRMRARMRKDKVNRVDRSRECTYLQRLIDYNKYTAPHQAKSFFCRHSDIIYSLIGVKKGKLLDEFESFKRSCTN